MTRKQSSAPLDPAGRPVLITVAEAVRYSGLPRSTVYELVKRGAIEHVRNGRSVYLNRASVEAFIATRTAEAMARFRGGA